MEINKAKINKIIADLISANDSAEALIRAMQEELSYRAEEGEKCRIELGNVRAELAEAYRSNEQLKKDYTIEIEAMRGAANSYKFHNAKLTEENKTLKAALGEDVYVFRASRSSGKTARCQLVFRIKKEAIVADTVRKMQERLKNEAFNSSIPLDAVARDWVDQIAKEILEEQ